jgi:hypothetical protein
MRQNRFNHLCEKFIIQEIDETQMREIAHIIRTKHNYLKRKNNLKHIREQYQYDIFGSELNYIISKH